MKRFVWRLQRVLDIKTREEQIKKIELLKLTEKLTQKRSELLIQKRIPQEIIAGLAGKDPRKRLSEQELFLKHSTTTDELIRQLEEQVSRLEEEQSEKIAEVLKLRRFREGLDKLRAQQKTEFTKEQEKLEQKEMDEMAAIRFARETDPALKTSCSVDSDKMADALSGKPGHI
ncbi:MAG: flagellar FliJ family protein [Phycisphaerae bacterium]|nr:flagellar FliJ family protein [Phycisphaerae bacterium]